MKNLRYGNRVFGYFFYFAVQREKTFMSMRHARYALKEGDSHFSGYDAVFFIVGITSVISKYACEWKQTGQTAGIRCR